MPEMMNLSKEFLKLKKRPLDKPIGIFVKDLKMAKKFAKIDKEKEKFLKKIGKGPLKGNLYFKKKRENAC